MSGEPPATAGRRNVEQYLHLPLMMGIAAISSAVVEFVEGPLNVFNTSSQLLFGWGVAFALMSIAMLETLMVRHDPMERLLRQSSRIEGFGALGIAVLVIVVQDVPALAFVAGAVALVAFVVAWGATARPVRPVVEAE